MPVTRGDTFEPGLRALLLAGAELISFGPGETVIVRGGTVNHLYVMQEGFAVADVLDGHGLPVEVARFGPEDFFGEMAFLRGGPASARVRMVDAARIWRIPHATLRQLADDHPAFMLQLARVLATRLSRTNQHFREARTGRVVLIGVEARDAGRLARHVAESAARHLRQPVALLDRSGWAGDEPGNGGDCEPKEALRRAAAGKGCELIRVDCTGQSHGVTASLATELSTHAAAVIVVVPSGQLGDFAAKGTSNTLLIQESAGRVVGVALDVPAVVIGPAASPATARELKEASIRHGRTVIRLVATAGLAVERPPGANREPWTGIDWVARHILGLKVGLALGAGGSKGYAHAGVLAGLIDLGVPIDYITGCSIGAPLACGFAYGFDPATVFRWLDHTFARALRPTLPFRSLLSNRALRNDMAAYLDRRRIEDSPMALSMVAVDLRRGSEVVFRSGPAAGAIVASMAIPGIFPPSRIAGRILVDGGVLNPVPIAAVAASGAGVVIGVKLTTPVVGRDEAEQRGTFRAPPIVETVHHAFEVMQWRIVSDGAARADVTIEPAFSGPTGLRDYRRGAEFVELGRAAAESAAGQIRQILPWVGGSDDR